MREAGRDEALDAFGAFWICSKLTKPARPAKPHLATNCRTAESHSHDVSESKPQNCDCLVYDMNAQSDVSSSTRRHAGPHLGMLAIAYTVLFNAGLCAVSAFGIPFGVRPPYWPGPWEPPDVIVSYFHTRPTNVLICVFLQIGAQIPLGIFAASIVSRLRFLGIDAAGPNIALFGGFLCVFDSMAAGFTTWAMIHPGVVQNLTITPALNYLSYASGGPGFSIPMGLLMAGVCVPAAFRKLLPKWLIVFGLFLAVAGELSWLNLVFPKALFLVPLVRFPGFVWLIATGFLLPKTVVSDRSASISPSFAS
jgi:hypothetical protein